MHWSFYLCLFFAVWLCSVNAIKGYRGQDVSWQNFVIMSVAIVGCVYSSIEL